MTERSMAELLIGICGGGVTAAGVFALISVIGIIPRYAGHSHTGRHMRGYEWAVIAGGTVGNLLWLFPVSLDFTGKAGKISESILGIGMGIYVGSLVMALAEVLKVFPLLIRRTKLKAGSHLLVLAVASGKMTGAILYFMMRQ